MLAGWLAGWLVAEDSCQPECDGALDVVLKSFVPVQTSWRSRSIGKEMEHPREMMLNFSEVLQCGENLPRAASAGIEQTLSGDTFRERESSHLHLESETGDASPLYNLIR